MTTMVCRIPLNQSTLGEEEISAAIEVLRSDQLTMGPRCFQFEREFEQHMGVSNAVFVNSGSSANLIALFALANPCVPACGKKRQILPGDEILVPAVTWSTTVWPVVQIGCVPVLVDCDPTTLQMSVESLVAGLSDRTRAIMPVHVLGGGTRISDIQSIAEEKGLWLIEDTCEALGTRFSDKLAGTIGDIGTYSFFFSHHITTIEGGMAVTNNDELGELFRALRAHGWTRHLRNREEVEARHRDIDPRFLFISTGFNLRPTEINAVLGSLQLRKLEKFNKRRCEIAEIWLRRFDQLRRDSLLMPMRILPDVHCTWFGFPVICADRPTRDGLRSHLENRRIETRPIICGNLARQPAFEKIPHRIASGTAGADRVMDCGLYWGSHPLMKNSEVEYVADCVMEFFRR
jgi:CDP-6-deoxy-D-xylo-4-hexulose-3-dehydrase